jgi:hypothetical protein
MWQNTVEQVKHVCRNLALRVQHRLGDDCTCQLRAEQELHSEHVRRNEWRVVHEKINEIFFSNLQFFLSLKL